MRHALDDEAFGAQLGDHALDLRRRHLGQTERCLHQPGNRVDVVLARAQLEHHRRRDIEVMHAAGDGFEDHETIIDLGGVKVGRLHWKISHDRRSYANVCRQPRFRE